MSLTDEVKRFANGLGFASVGVAQAQPSTTITRYLNWIENGMHGTMQYMSRPDRVARRRDLNLLVADAKAIIVVSWNYSPQPLPLNILSDPLRGRISNYAWQGDYHVEVLPRLNQIVEFIASETHGESRSRAYVDTGAILERSHGRDANLGFIGKNTMLIDPRRGSYQFLGVVITTCDLDPDPIKRQPSCGTCMKCLAKCPTHAFPEPFVLDSRRCISYLTIEHKGFIDRTLRPLMGNWIFGCDVCQDVCPWQRFGRSESTQRLELVDFDRAAPRLATLLEMDESDFVRAFNGSALIRIGRDRLVRNASIAAGNSHAEALSEQLAKLLRDKSALVRGHAAWALGEVGPPIPELRQALKNETDSEVRVEIEASLSRLDTS